MILFLRESLMPIICRSNLHPLISTPIGRDVVYSSSTLIITALATGVLYSTVFWTPPAHNIFYGMACVILFAVDVALLILVTCLWQRFKDSQAPRGSFTEMA